jgi:hypothetical protein
MKPIVNRNWSSHYSESRKGWEPRATRSCTVSTTSRGLSSKLNTSLVVDRRTMTAMNRQWINIGASTPYLEPDRSHSSLTTRRVAPRRCQCNIPQNRPSLSAAIRLRVMDTVPFHIEQAGKLSLTLRLVYFGPAHLRENQTTDQERAWTYPSSASGLESAGLWPIQECICDTFHDLPIRLTAMPSISPLASTRSTNQLVSTNNDAYVSTVRRILDAHFKTGERRSDQGP